MEDATNCKSILDDNNSPGGLFAGKYASYFSTMNPLATRIYEDIHKVELKCKNFGELSYDEKCSVIDKHLLFNNGSTADVSHTAAMLMSVYPSKKPEICEDDNHDISVLLEKHSGRFSSCTESDIGACNLGKLLKRVTLLTKKKQQRASMSKKTKKAPAPKPTLSRSSTESGIDEAATLPTDRHSWFHEDELKNYGIESSANKKHELIEPKRLNKAVITHHDDEDADDRLPNQKQNLDLIAELQAKLKRNKGGSSDEHWSGNSPVLKHHIVKPKAPPPPPPPQKTDVGKKAAVQEETNSNKKNSTDHHDEFLVDVSSPCRIATPKTGFDFLDNW